jgi:Flp pilus assembly protein TadB
LLIVHPMGKVMLGIGVLGQLAGIIAIRKIITINV